MPSAFPGFQLLVDQLLELLEWLGTAQQPSVDEKRGCAVDSDVLSSRDVGVNGRLVCVRLDACIEFRRVEPEIGRSLLEVGVVQLRLIREEAIVVRPEFT